MKVVRSFVFTALLPVAALFVAGCDAITGLGGDPDAPRNLAYQLIPSGDPNAPLGVLLTWEVPSSGQATAFNVYGRTGGNSWQLRATTTSPTFHDAGTPETQYYVATRDDQGDDIGSSNIVTIDLQSRLPAPTGLGSVSLNAAVQLFWSSNAVDASRASFDHYIIYSTSYDATRGVCSSGWVWEGQTVSDGFLVGNLQNGVSRCYAVSAVTHDGHESVWSEAHLDTPRLDARNAFVYARTTRTDSAGFLFFDDVAKKSGTVGSTARTDLDFTVERHADGTLWLAPGRAGVTMMLYSQVPVAGLTSIDAAPGSGYGSVSIEAVPGFAYVFRLQKADGVHFAAARVAFVTADYVVFDWSYQSAIGNPELNVVPVRPSMTH